MKKYLMFALVAIAFSSMAFIQNVEKSQHKVYNPTANAKADVKAAVEKAKKEGKHVLLQIGGNWCIWCMRFNEKATTNDTLKTELEKDFVVYHLNYSKENKNEEILAELGFPQRFGFPVFVVLDGNGNRLNTQNSEYLEEGKGYSMKKIFNFLKQWSPAALDAKTYQEAKK
jgi:thioredoxin-related protein